MDHSLKHALRQLIRLEAGTRTLLQSADHGSILDNASTVEREGARAESGATRFVVGDPHYGTLADDAPWAELG